MTNLTNEQKARLMARYIGQMLCVPDVPKETFWPYDHREGGLKLIGVIGSSVIVQRIAEEQIDHNYQTKLILKPLSQISDEDAILIYIIKRDHSVSLLRSKDKKIAAGKQIVRDFIAGGCYWNAKLLMAVYQLLILKGYDLPVFIEPNHPDNGKTMQELGLVVYE